MATAASRYGHLRINASRLWGRLMEMARIGATANGGCNRQALSDEDGAARRLFIQWCRAAGCEVRHDAIGNIFARRCGRVADAPVVMTGSHLDTQPTGGKFDGVYGVLAGLEILETLNDNGIQTQHSIELVVWTNEEGCRFDTAMLGSAVWSGAMPLAAAWALTDRTGHTVREELERLGCLGEPDREPHGVKAAFELHIEQGPVLEMQGKTIGVVTRVQHMSRHRVVIEGEEAHAGPTPMRSRKDPVMALARILPALYALADRYAPEARVTVGVIQVRPGSSNTIPGQLEFTVDLRHPDAVAYDELLSGYRAAVHAACGHFDMPVKLECFWESPGIHFDARCVDAVHLAVRTLGYEALEMFSGAGHDACNLARVVPTAMIFIPCDRGISHNELENTSPEFAAAGANVLLQAMLNADC